MTDNQKNNSIILLYLPVIHAGYINFLNNHPQSEVFIIDESFISFIDKEFDYLRKEIRSLQPSQAVEALQSIFPKRKISLLSKDDFQRMNSKSVFNNSDTAASKNLKLILPKEDIFIWLAKKYLKNVSVEFDETFLRWNRNNSTQNQEIKTSHEISSTEFSKKMMKLAEDQKVLSSDWWRQVGAVLVLGNQRNTHSKNAEEGKLEKKVIVAHNKHLPSPYSSYIDSDPRNSFHKGENIDISTAIHAEADLIAQAAKTGQSLEGNELYVTTFPCPTCAKLIACSGISKLYFKEGYSVVDGEQILTNSGVKIVKISD